MNDESDAFRKIADNLEGEMPMGPEELMQAMMTFQMSHVLERVEVLKMWKIVVSALAVVSVLAFLPVAIIVTWVVAFRYLF
jgi:hypothetical protein